jgi:putative endonuclease
MTGFVYILSNKKDGVLYVGVTADLNRRIWEHKQKEIDGFSRRYNLDKLIYYEEYDRIDDAIQREKNIKNWKRDWKTELINAQNPDWLDLYHDLSG